MAATAASPGPDQSSSWYLVVSRIRRPAHRGTTRDDTRIVVGVGAISWIACAANSTAAIMQPLLDLSTSLPACKLLDWVPAVRAVTVLHDERGNAAILQRDDRSLGCLVMPWKEERTDPRLLPTPAPAISRRDKTVSHPLASCGSSRPWEPSLDTSLGSRSRMG